MSARDKPINLADPEFEPTDAQLRTLWRRAVEGLEEQYQRLHEKRLDEALEESRRRNAVARQLPDAP